MDMKTVNVQTKQDNTVTLLDVGGAWMGLMTAMPQLIPNLGLPTYRPTEINYDGKRYMLKEPLMCTVTWEEVEGEAFYSVDYEPFELYASGDTVEEAIDLFAFKFADTYAWLNKIYDHSHELGAVRLSEDLEKERQKMNRLVWAIIPVIQ
jgi:hypothetical protein